MTIVLRPLSIGELLDRTFSLYRSNFLLFVGIMFLSQFALYAAVVGAYLPLLLAVYGKNDIDAALGGFLFRLIFFFLIYLVLYATGIAATVYAASQVHLEKRTSMLQSYRFVLRRLWPVIAVFIVIVLATVLGLVALVVGALIVFAFCSLAVPITVLEGLGPIASIRRSFYLVKDSVGRIIVILILFVVIGYGVAWLFTIPSIVIAFIFVKSPIVFLVMQNLGNFIAGALVGPLLPIAISLVYYDARVRHEGFDLQLMMATMDGSAAGESV
jgi:hypothetical protein